MDRNLALEAVRVTEAAALAAVKQMGRGDENMADQVAVDAMRQALNRLSVDGTVVIGEGERDAAPMLYIGEKVGKGGPEVDIALDPLEGTAITACGGPNALAVIAMAETGGFLNAPDVYMEKISVGGGLPDGVIDIDAPPADNIKRVAAAKAMPVEEVVVCILNRPRHRRLIGDVRAMGARICLIEDGDVSGIIATAQRHSGIHMYMGAGGAPEGVLAAAALRCLGGQMQAKLILRDDEERRRARHWGIEDAGRVYRLNDLAKGDVMFAATGVTDGAMLKGIHSFPGGAASQSIVMRSKTGTVRTIDTTHRHRGC